MEIIIKGLNNVYLVNFPKGLVFKAVDWHMMRTSGRLVVEVKAGNASKSKRKCVDLSAALHAAQFRSVCLFLPDSFGSLHNWRTVFEFA